MFHFIKFTDIFGKEDKKAQGERDSSLKKATMPNTVRLNMMLD